MSLESILTIIAVLISPLIAVQATRLIDERKERRARKLAVFRALMSTRAATLSDEHVNALNSIDIEFSGKSLGEKNIREAWKAYLSHLNNQSMSLEQWLLRRTDLLVELLLQMGKYLSYDFDKTHISEAIYSPVAHGQLESEQAEFRRLGLQLLRGERSIPISLSEVSEVEEKQDLLDSPDTADKQ